MIILLKNAFLGVFGIGMIQSIMNISSKVDITQVDNDSKSLGLVFAWLIYIVLKTIDELDNKNH